MDPLWAVAGALVLGSVSVSVALVVASRYVAGTVGAALTTLAEGVTGTAKWEGEFLTEKDLGDLWAAKHPAEAREYNAGQLTREQAQQVADTRPWEVDLEKFDQTWGEGLDQLFEEEAEQQAKMRRGQPAVLPVDGAATREAEKSWR